jgi:hypothetical protein
MIPCILNLNVFIICLSYNLFIRFERHVEPGLKRVPSMLWKPCYGDYCVSSFIIFFHVIFKDCLCIIDKFLIYVAKIMCCILVAVMEMLWGSIGFLSNMLYRENLNKLIKQWWFFACDVVCYLNILVCVKYQVVCVIYTIWICVVMLYDVAM